MPRYDLVLRNARTLGNPTPGDVGVGAGRLAALAPRLADRGAAEVDADGRLLIPGFVDAHIHVDKALVADQLEFPEGNLAVGDAVAAMGRLKRAYTPETLYARGRRLLAMAVRHGVTAIRTQCDVDPICGLMPLEVLCRLREEFAPCLTMQIVAFPQEGLLRGPGTVDLIRQALRRGADCPGGGPLDADVKAHIDQVFALAREFGTPVDLHTDLGTDNLRPVPEWECVYAAGKAIEAGLGGRVCVHHLAALGAVTPEEAEPALTALARAGVSVNALPASEMYRQGMRDPVNARRGMTRVKDLLAAGVNVCFASNNVRDAFVTFGCEDLLEQAWFGAQAAHLAAEAELATALEMVTTRPARAIGLAEYGVALGAQADLVLLDAETPADAVRRQAEKLYVWKRGRLVARNTRRTDVWVPR